MSLLDCAVVIKPVLFLFWWNNYKEHFRARVKNKRERERECVCVCRCVCLRMLSSQSGTFSHPVELPFLSAPPMSIQTLM